MGITAIELAQGSAPYSTQNAMKVILSILNDAPPTLKNESSWDASLVDFVNSCLKKDPSERLSID